MIKKIVILLVIISNVFLITSCWNYTEIDKTSIVAGIAIDKGEKDKKYNITAEIVELTGGQQSSPMSSRLIEADGNTIFEAVRNLISVNRFKLYFGHCKLIIIDEQPAREGIIPIMDSLFRDHEVRLTNDVLISKGVKAKKILLQKFESPTVNSYDINNMLDNRSQNLSKATKMQIYQIVNSLSTKGISSILPTIIIEKSNDKEIYKITGSAFFKKDKLFGFLNDEESQSLLFILNNIKSSPLTTKIYDKENLYITAEVYDNDTSIKFNYENDELSVDIKVKTIVVINDVGTYTNFVDVSEYKALESKFEDQLENSIKSLVNKAQTEYDSDIFGFGKMLNDENQSLWEKYESNWDETFKTLKINVNSKFIIRSSGSIRSTIRIGG